MGFRYADENIRFYLSDTFKEILVAHARVDQNNDCANFEECKG